MEAPKHQTSKTKSFSRDFFITRNVDKYMMHYDFRHTKTDNINQLK